ncbi:MAG: hypothetical protein SF069_05725 [Phycisphaerae bacterium]|nr:hypothetical protein [Phycisphaerae bacterium]
MCIRNTYSGIVGPGRDPIDLTYNSLEIPIGSFTLAGDLAECSGTDIIVDNGERTLELTMNGVTVSLLPPVAALDNGTNAGGVVTVDLTGHRLRLGSGAMSYLETDAAGNTLRAGTVLFASNPLTLNITSGTAVFDSDLSSGLSIQYQTSNSPPFFGVEQFVLSLSQTLFAERTLPSGEALEDACFPDGTTLHPYSRSPGNPWLAGEWNAESANIVGATGGITPFEGATMLRVNFTGGVASQVSQILDVNAWASQIDAGLVRLRTSVRVNAAAATTAPSISALAGTSQTAVGTVNPVGGSIVPGFNRAMVSSATDANPATWQIISTKLRLPAGTRYVHFELAGINATIPAPGLFFDCATVELRRFLPGDLNGDGFISVSDISGFVLALTNPDEYAAQYPDGDIENADMNLDGVISVGDIGQFVEALTGI